MFSKLFTKCDDDSVEVEKAGAGDQGRVRSLSEMKWPQTKAGPWYLQEKNYLKNCLEVKIPPRPFLANSSCLSPAPTQGLAVSKHNIFCCYFWRSRRMNEWTNEQTIKRGRGGTHGWLPGVWLGIVTEVERTGKRTKFREWYIVESQITFELLMCAKPRDYEFS